MNQPEESLFQRRIAELKQQKNEHQLMIRSIDREIASLQKEHAAMLRRSASPPRPIPVVERILQLVSAPMSERDIVAALPDITLQSVHQALEYHTRPASERHTKKDTPSLLVCVIANGNGYKLTPFINKGRGGEVPENLVCSRAWFESQQQ